MFIWCNRSGLIPNNEFVEILFWMDAFKRASANSVTAIIPYFSYAKGDKKDEPRVSIRARVCAESIELAGADRVVMMDLHSPQVQGFFKIPVDHLMSMPILCEYVKAQGWVDENLVIVSPDAGFAKNARRYADYLGVGVAIGDKARIAHDEKAQCLNIIGDVKGKTCLIVDDFSISGETLKEVAVELQKNGAAHIYACISHMVLKKKGVEVIDNSPIERLIATDTVPNPYPRASKKIKILSVAPLFAEAVYRIHSRMSIGAMLGRFAGKGVGGHRKDGGCLVVFRDIPFDIKPEVHPARHIFCAVPLAGQRHDCGNNRKPQTITAFFF